MDIIYPIVLVLSLSTIFFMFSNDRKNKERIKKLEDDIRQRHEQNELEYDKNISQALQEKKGELESAVYQLREVELKRQAKEEHYLQLQENIKLLAQHEKDMAKTYREVETARVDAEVVKYQEEQIKAIDKLLEEHHRMGTAKKEMMTIILSELKDEVTAEHSKRHALNEARLREEQVELEKDFYKMFLTDDDKSDIEYLLSIDSKIHHRELLRKLIWSTFLLPASNAMTKRVLEGKSPCGIYKITDSKGKAYIGRSTDIKKRWQEHIKASLGIGSIAHYGIHDALRKRGWDDFTFEVLEICDKDALGEREKFYINFYEVSVYGYNKTSGG